MLIIANGIDAQLRQGDPKLTEVWQPEPKVINPGKTSQDAPSDATILFNGKDFSQWQHVNGNAVSWTIKDNYMQCKPGSGNIQTKQGFGDCQLHIEWRTPDTARGEGQERGNSGIFFMGRYELQVLDSYHNRTYSNGQAGSIYKQYMPLVNVCRGPGEWQTYDVIFTAPRFNSDSTVKSPARITVLQNGVLVQNNVSLWGGTEYIGIPAYQMHGDKEPLVLQDHGNTVKYRNIWIREL
jgi:3-keto-disaccharide hydrolase